MVHRVVGNLVKRICFDHVACILAHNNEKFRLIVKLVGHFAWRQRDG